MSEKIYDGGPAFTDTELLDFLDSHNGYGDGVVFRMSTRGRGWRLHETSGSPFDPGRNEVVKPMPTARQAIADALLAERSRTHV